MSAANNAAKSPPTPELVHRRACLQQMAARGTTHEAAVAQAKLAAMEAKYDFAAAATETDRGDDLFGSLARRFTTAKKRRTIIEMPVADEETGNFVKWAFLQRFNLDSFWDKSKPGKAILCAAVAKDDARALREVARVILADFKTLWTQYSEKNTLRPGDRRPFSCGLFDGMMETPRSEGERIPAPARASTKKRRGPAKKPIRQPAEPAPISAHPYELGLVLGARIRANTPLRELQEQLRLMMDAGKTSDESS